MPYLHHKETIVTCYANRKQALRLIQDYYKHKPRRDITTVLSDYKMPPSMLCPEKGVYTLTLKNNILTLHCTIEDHEKYKKDTASIALPGR
jgi:hypothetical protein